MDELTENEKRFISNFRNTNRSLTQQEQLMLRDFRRKAPVTQKVDLVFEQECKPIYKEFRELYDGAEQELYKAAETLAGELATNIYVKHGNLIRRLNNVIDGLGEDEKRELLRRREGEVEAVLNRDSIKEITDGLMGFLEDGEGRV